MTASPLMELVCNLLHTIDNKVNHYVGVLKLDPYLEPYKDVLKRRYAKAKQWIAKIDESEGGLEKFSRVRSIDLAGRQSLTDYRAMSVMAFRCKRTAM